MILSKIKIKEIAGLKHGKQRIEQQAFLVEGIKMVDELLKSSITIICICATQEWIIQNEKKIVNVPIYQISEQELKKISNLNTPNQVVAVAGMPEMKINQKTIYEKLTLVLDEIKDPGNMGAIIRTADWFGIENIVCSPTSVDIYNPKVIQSTMGSLFRVKIFYSDIVEFLKQKPLQLETYGTLLSGNSIYEKELNEKGLIVIGNESQGISPEVQNLITQPLHIPRFSSKSGAESLNAAMATAIVCSEFRRRTQTQKNQK